MRRTPPSYVALSFFLVPSEKRVRCHNHNDDALFYGIIATNTALTLALTRRPS